MAAAKFSAEERQRYARQLLIPGWGEAAQRRLGRACVFVAGAGGLGSPLLLYLAAAGVGRLRVCDSGRVELSNLNRQLLYAPADIGRGKAEAAAEALGRLNPHVSVEPLSRPIAAASVAELAGEADLIVDCLDNFPTRFVLNAHCVERQTPLLHAGVMGLGGQIALLDPPRTACLACFVPPPDAAASPGGTVREGPGRKARVVPGGTAGAGRTAAPAFPILGATAGVLGCLQALEALKLLGGLGTTLAGRLLFCDGEAGAFHEVTLQKDPHCPVCGAR